MDALLTIVFWFAVGYVGAEVLTAALNHRAKKAQKKADEAAKAEFYGPDDLPQEFEHLRHFYEAFGCWPRRRCHDSEDGRLLFPADSTEKTYGSKRATVVYCPGSLNGANWRVCGKDKSGQFETFSFNIFATQRDAVKWAIENGYDFDICTEEKSWPGVSSDEYAKWIAEHREED